MYIKHNIPQLHKLENGAGYNEVPVDWVDAFEEDDAWQDAWDAHEGVQAGALRRTREGRATARTRRISARVGRGRIVPATDAEVLREDMRTHTRDEAISAAGRRVRRPAALADFI